MGEQRFETIRPAYMKHGGNWWLAIHRFNRDSASFVPRFHRFSPFLAGENHEGRAFDFRIGRLGQDKEEDKWIPFNPDR